MENNDIFGKSPISQPYPYIKDKFTIEFEPDSPDPLINYKWDNPKHSDDLEIFVIKPYKLTTESPNSFINLDSAKQKDVDIVVKDTGTVMLDFKTEFAGWLEIDSPNLNGQVTLGISEYNKPAIVNNNQETKNHIKTAVPKKYNNIYRLELNEELYEGVRFGFINVVEFNKPFHITGIRLVCQTKPVNYNGSFKSDNEMLNKIWYTAAYTVRVNLKKDYFAAILMDRGDRFSWTGDAYPAQAAALVAFANYDFVLQNLHYTSTRGNQIESYELYWVFSLIDYYKHTGDKKGVQSMNNAQNKNAQQPTTGPCHSNNQFVQTQCMGISLMDEAVKRLEHAYDVFGKNPDLHYFGWDERLGAGFENPNTTDNQNAYKMLCIRAWKEFGVLLSEFDTKLSEKYLKYAKEKTLELKSDTNLVDNFGLHTVADALNAGFIEDCAIEDIYNKHFKNRLNRLSYSPFNQYFILQAMANTGNYDDAIEAILDMYSGQIEYGGTTFFEVYRPQWNDVLRKNVPVPNGQVGYTSLAHPWGSGVLSWLSSEILGIKPDTAGFKTFTVKPNLGRHLKEISGEMPTPYGNIQASFNLNSGICSLTVPNGTVGKIGIPRAEKTILSVEINGVHAKSASEDDDFIYFDNLQKGRYEFVVSYDGKQQSFDPLAYAEKDIKCSSAVYNYDAKLKNKDYNTKGNWIEKYGFDGYLLCNYNSSSDYCKLPNYIEDIKFNLVRKIVWSDNTTDNRALVKDSGNIIRKAAAYTSQDGDNCGQSFTVDIAAAGNEKYSVSLYFLDWDCDGRELEIDMYDGETLNLIAPAVVLNDYTGGVYVTYEYNKSIRFRIHQIRGKNAALSGIFFG